MLTAWQKSYDLVHLRLLQKVNVEVVQNYDGAGRRRPKPTERTALSLPRLLLR